MKKYRFTKITGVFSLLFLGALGCFSCQDEISPQGDGMYDAGISFAVGSGDSVDSRSTEPGLSDVKVANNLFLMSVGKDSLFVGMTEEENVVSVVESRGASITTANIGSFRLTAYQDDGTEWVSGSWTDGGEGNTIVRESENSTRWKFNPDKNWPEDYRPLHFHGYSSSKECGFNPTFTIEGSDTKICKGSFSYTLPAPETDDDKKDGNNQPDLIVAITPGCNRKTDVVDIDFYHALSAVVFRVGDMPENTRLKSITLKGVNSTGDCTYTTSSGNVPSIKWTSNTPKDYTQTFGSDLTDDTDITTTASEAAFMMIPQEFSEDAVVSVEVTVDEPEDENATSYSRTYVANLKLKGLIKDVAGWEAHKKYTYTLSLKEGVTVDVSDKVSDDGSLKDNVVITNTGESTSYIRAAIVGHWINEAGIILSPWSVGDHATGTFNGLANGSWLEGNDGFFYYKKPVAPGGVTDELFNSYELKVTAPIIGAKLEFNIVVQAIHYKQVMHSGWPVEVNNGELSLKN